MPSLESSTLPSMNSSDGSLYVLIRTVAIDGQMCCTLYKATCLFRELKALEASTSKAASVELLSNKCLVVCTPASIPETWPAQSCSDPTASSTSCLVIDRMVLAMMRLTVSPMPIGRTPGFLLRAMSLQVKKAEIHLGSTKEVHNRLAVAASERQRSPEAAPNEVHRLLQPWASTSEGPAAPSTHIATDLSNRVGRLWIRI